MSAFAGLVRFDGAPLDKHIEDQIGRALVTRHSGRVFTRRLPGALFVRHVTAGASSDLQQPLIGAGGRFMFAAQARLDNRQELGEALNIATADLASIVDDALIWRMFERSGDRGLAGCLGTFAFAFWDSDSGRLILGRDCLGHQPMFFHAGRGFVAFATTLRTLLALPDVPRQPDELVLANYLAINLGEPRRTFYRDVERVPGRTLVTIDRAGIAQRAYWSPDLDPSPLFRRDEDYVARARELFDQAVASATEGATRVAIAGSGGLDSSAVVATAAKLGRAESLTCYSLVPPASTHIDVGPYKYWDERDKMQALARMHPGIDLRLVAPERPHPYEDDASRYFARTAMPALNPSNLGWFSHLYDAARVDGHRLLLTGQRGNFGLTWGGRFSLLALFRSGQWLAFAREARAVARQSNRGLGRTLVSQMLIPGGPLWLRRLLYRLSRGDPDDVSFYSVLNPDFIADHKLVQQWQAEGFEQPWFRGAGWNAARFRAHWLFDYNQVGRDGAAITAEQHGLDLRDPHADRRLLEFALAVPEPLYRRNGVPRSFARAVFADRLPREILGERRSGSQAGAWFQRLDMRRDDIAVEIERLEASPLAWRLIDIPRLKRLMADWPKDGQAAERRKFELHLALDRGLHVGQFIRWVEGGNAPALDVDAQSARSTGVGS